MASEGDARSNKQATVTFTLPVSCQICLGKVKQPVLCPNLHVFCQLCLDIWLKRNSQCPACRVEIGPDNPVKHIIGGQIDDDNSVKQSTPDLRRARFDLLYKEYEDQFEQMRKEVIILRTENNILLAQLKDAEEENENYKKGKDKTSSSSSGPSQASDGPSLLMLTKNLQEAQKLYAGIKDDMAKLKQENGKLKDENVNLTRENENLRLEIAQRSPKKFGRYTVATLEAKLAEKEKEVKQLTMALERCDTYIEELLGQLERYSKAKEAQGEKRIGPAEASGKGGGRFQINLEPKHSEGNDNLNLESRCTEVGAKFSFRPENAKRTLFGKVFVDEAGKQAHAGHNGTAEETLNPLQRQSEPGCSSSTSISGDNRISHRDLTGGLFSLRPNGPQIHVSNNFSQEDHVTASNHQRSVSHSQSHRPNDRQSNDFSTQSQMKNVTKPHPQESIMKSNLKTPGTQAEDMRSDSEEPEERERTPRKVHFQVPGKTNDTSSFDLELPSPMEKSSVQNESQSSETKKLHSATTTATISALSGDQGNQEKTADSDFDKKILNLLRMNNMPSMGAKATSTTTSGARASKAIESGDTETKRFVTTKSKKGAAKMKTSVKSKAPKKGPPKPQDSNDSSHLSVPDLGTPEGRVSSLGDSSGDIKEEILDLDLSMTPELDDCLRLMDRAERNLGGSVPATSSSGSSATFLPTHDQGSTHISSGRGQSSAYPTSNGGSSSQVPRPSSVPPHLPSSYNRPPSYLASSTSSAQGFVPAGGTISGWEQQFFSTLRANPYRFSHANKPYDIASSIKSEPRDDAAQHHMASNGSKDFISALDLDSSRRPQETKDFRFSEPIRVSHPTSQSQTSYDHKYQLPEPTERALRGLSNPFSLHLNFPGLSGGAVSFPSSSSGYSQLATSTAGSHVSSSQVLSSSMPPPSSSLALSSSSSMSQSSKHTYSLAKYLSDLPDYKKSNSTHPTRGYDNPLPPSLNNSALEWPDDSPSRAHNGSFPAFHRDSDDLPRPSSHRNSTDFDSFTTDFRPPYSSRAQSHYSYVSNTSNSDANASTFLPEPKKRLFDTMDDLDFTISPKTTKR